MTPAKTALITLIENNYKDMTPEEIATVIIDAGFISLHHSIAGQVAEWLALEAENVITNGDIAEVCTPIGEVGRSNAIDARDCLCEDPTEWLRTKAAALGIGDAE